MARVSKQHLGDIFTEQIQTKLVIVLKSMCVMLMSLDILYAGEIFMIYNNINTIGMKYTVCSGSVFFFSLVHFLLFFACGLKLDFAYYHTNKQRKRACPLKKSNLTLL